MTEESSPSEPEMEQVPLPPETIADTVFESLVERISEPDGDTSPLGISLREIHEHLGPESAINAALLHLQATGRVKVVVKGDEPYYCPDLTTISEPSSTDTIYDPSTQKPNTLSWWAGGEFVVNGKLLSLGQRERLLLHRAFWAAVYGTGLTLEDLNRDLVALGQEEFKNGTAKKTLNGIRNKLRELKVPEEIASRMIYTKSDPWFAIYVNPDPSTTD